MLEPGPDNPTGFWEQAALVKLNDELLAVLGGTWAEPPELAPGWERRPEVRRLKPRAEELLGQLFGDSPAWVWKDPRASLTLPFWQELMPDPAYVVCVRSPSEVVESLLARPTNLLSVDSAMALWLRYCAAALEHTANCRRTVVFYDDFLPDPWVQAARLARFVGKDPATVPAQVRSAIRTFVDTDLRHTPAAVETTGSPEGASLEARTFYLALRAANPPPVRTGSVGDRGVAEALESLAPAVWHGFARRRRVVADAASEVAALRSRLADAQEQLMSLDVRCRKAEQTAHDRGVELETAASVREALTRDRERLLLETERLMGERDERDQPLRRAGWFSRRDGPPGGVRIAGEPQRARATRLERFALHRQAVVALMWRRRGTWRQRLGALSERPVFVVGSPRSGTTFLGRSIGSLPGFVDMGELAPFKAAMEDGLPTLPAEPAASRIRRTLAVTRRLGLVGSLRPVEQTPEGAFVIEAIFQAFPDARVIHMLRDGRDVASSLLELGWVSSETTAHDDVGHSFGSLSRFWVEPERAVEFMTTSDARRAAWTWRRYVSAARGAGGRVHQVGYERLVEVPDEVAGELEEYLGVPAGCLSEPLEQAHGGSIGRYRRDLTSDQIGDFLAESGDLLRELGYS